jgi:hypothetical protein
MSRTFRVGLVIVCLVFVSVVIWQSLDAGTEWSVRLQTKETEEWLISTTLGRFVLEDASVEEAIEVINGEIETAPRRLSNLRVRLATGEETAKCFKPPLKPLAASPKIRGLPSGSQPASGTFPSMSGPSDRKMTLRLENIPAREVIMYVAGLSDLEWDIRGHSILLHRVPSMGGTVKPLVAKSLRFRWLPPQFDEKSGIDPR